MEKNIPRYYSLNQYLKETFGCKVYKLALDGGMTCPNRDGTLGNRGCVFCSAGGSGEFAERISLKEESSGIRTMQALSLNSLQAGHLELPGIPPIWEQIESAKTRVRQKIKSGKYIAYFQSYTNTYAPTAYLEQLFSRAIAHPDIAALSIATRPDCLPPDVLALLGRLNNVKPVWVELGLQTMHPRTAEYIRRGYGTDCYIQAVRDLKTAGVSHIITHVILGLPGESPDEMIETVRFAAETGTDGIKLQLLHVLKGTDLAAEYARGRFQVMSLEQYCGILCRCIEALPPHVVIHRLTGDGPKRLLIAPMWSGDKKRVLNTIMKEMKERNVWQGAAAQPLCRPAHLPSKHLAPSPKQ